MTDERVGGPPIGEDDLQAYVDGRLPASRRDAVDAYLTAHPAAAAQVPPWKPSSATSCGPACPSRPQEPIPARLRIANIMAEQSHEPPPACLLKAIAAALAWLVIGIGAGAGGGMAWYGRIAPLQSPVVADLAAFPTRDHRLPDLCRGSACIRWRSPGRPGSAPGAMAVAPTGKPLYLRPT